MDDAYFDGQAGRNQDDHFPIVNGVATPGGWAAIFGGTEYSAAHNGS